MARQGSTPARCIATVPLTRTWSRPDSLPAPWMRGQALGDCTRYGVRGYSKATPRRICSQSVRACSWLSKAGCDSAPKLAVRPHQMTAHDTRMEKNDSTKPTKSFIVPSSRG